MKAAGRGALGHRWSRLTLGAALGVVVALLMVGPTFAQEADSTVSPVGGAVSGYSVTDWMNLLLRLALVLVVIWFAIMAMRWWVRRMNGGVGNGGGHLQVVETRSLGPNRSLQLVKVGSRAVLLGVTNERISPVLEIDDPAEVERLGRPNVAEDSPTSFGDAVSRLGSLTRWRPVIERKRSPQPATQPARASNVAAAPQMPLLAPAPKQRSRWVTLGRRVIGLEDPPRRAVVPASGAPPAAPGRAPRSIAAARSAAAELPASRASRARTGYRQNSIAEAQRAIASVRAEMTR